MRNTQIRGVITFVGLIMWLIALTQSIAPNTASAAGFTKRVVSNTNSRCLEMGNSGAATSGVSPQIWNCLEVLWQEWEFRPMANSTDYQIVNKKSGYCLETAGSTMEGVAQKPCITTVYSAAQAWELTSNSQTTIRSRGTTKCLNTNGSSSNGTSVGVYPCTSSSLWNLIDTYQGRMAIGHSSKCLEIGGGSTANGVQAQQWTCVNFGWQQWQLVDLYNGYYYLQNVHTQKCLEIAAPHDNMNGRAAQQWTCDPYTFEWQQWQIVSIGFANQAYLVNRYTGRCLEIAGTSSTSNGVKAQQWTCVSGANQRWSLLGEIIVGGV